jgi:hypothetical protein
MRQLGPINVQLDEIDALQILALHKLVDRHRAWPIVLIAQQSTLMLDAPIVQRQDQFAMRVNHPSAAYVSAARRTSGKVKRAPQPAIKANAPHKTNGPPARSWNVASRAVTTEKSDNEYAVNFPARSM